MDRLCLAASLACSGGTHLLDGNRGHRSWQELACLHPLAGPHMDCRNGSRDAAEMMLVTFALTVPEVS